VLVYQGKKMIVGLTGGIGSGKSVVSAQLKTLGAWVVDSDQVARDVVVAGSPALAAIAKHFGHEILLENGTLNRVSLRQKIFADKAQKQWLEALLHPLISCAVDAQLATSHGIYSVLESPLLLETLQYKKTSFVVVVDTSEALQRQRACQRDASEVDQINAIMNAQLPRHERLLRADWVLDNQHDLKCLSAKVLQLHQHLCQMTEQPL
tara:strand:+ start:671 stop:1294 length:624 start_codon:yes stop_codon:yes gene_type:complete